MNDCPPCNHDCNQGRDCPARKREAALQAKNAKQRNEIARLTQALEKLTAEKAKLLADIKWMRGEA